MGAKAAALAAGLWTAAAGAVLGQEIPYAPVVAPAAGLSVCPGGLCQAEALNGWFEALAATEGGTRGGPVHIVQLGDSHTAGDRITGKVRAMLQRRFGDAGRGVLPPGAPYEGYAPYQVEVVASGWRTILPPLAGPGGGQTTGVGLTGVQSIEVEAGSELRLRIEGRQAIAFLISVCGQGPGRLWVRADNEVWAERRFDAHGRDGSCVYLMADGRPDEIVLRPLDATLQLHDVRLSYMAAGVTLSNLGVIGATLRDLAARDETVVGLQLANWRPALIVLAYGTNEGFEDALDPAAYEALLRGQIARLRRLAPASSLLILAAPDALRNGVLNGCSADGQRAPPPSLAVVRDVQRRVSADLGVAFWDWHGRMGGDCSADRLATLFEPYVHGDRVHFTSVGSDWIGGLLGADLLAAYDAWAAGRGEGQ